MIAVQDGEIVGLGETPSLGRYVALRDAYGNTYTYAELGSVATLYPVLEPHEHTAVSSRIAQAGACGRTRAERSGQRGRAAPLAAVRRRHRLRAGAGRGGKPGNTPAGAGDPARRLDPGRPRLRRRRHRGSSAPATTTSICTR